MSKLSAITLALCVFGASAAVQADTVTLPGAGAAYASEAPVRGMSMDQVRAGYGSPREIKTAVGEPPITRWVYEGYTVYFEYRHVIHSVPHQP